MNWLHFGPNQGAPGRYLKIEVRIRRISNLLSIVERLLSTLVSRQPHEIGVRRLKKGSTKKRLLSVSESGIDNVVVNGTKTVAETDLQFKTVIGCQAFQFEQDILIRGTAFGQG